jgi:hypothetical protein
LFGVVVDVELIGRIAIIILKRRARHGRIRMKCKITASKVMKVCKPSSSNLSQSSTQWILLVAQVPNLTKKKVTKSRASYISESCRK